MVIKTYIDCVKEAGASDNLLEKVSSHRQYKRVRWANGQIGVIADVKNNGTLCFIELEENQKAEGDLVDNKDTKSHPFVACGFVAYLLTRFGDDTAGIFNDYYDSCCRRLQSDKKSPDAWKKVGDENNKMLTENDIEDELALMWQSRTLLPYFTDADHKALQLYCKNYIDFMRERFEQLWGIQYDTYSDMLFFFRQMYDGKNALAMKCIEWLVNERDGFCPPTAPDRRQMGTLGQIVFLDPYRSHFSDSIEEGEFLHHVLVPYKISKSAEKIYLIDFDKLRDEIASKIEECNDEFACKNYVKSLLEPLREFANKLDPEYVIKAMKKDMAEGWMSDIQKRDCQRIIEKITKEADWLVFSCGMNSALSYQEDQSSVKAIMGQSLFAFITGQMELLQILAPLLLVRNYILKDWLTEWELPLMRLDMPILYVDNNNVYTEEHAQKLIEKIRTPKISEESYEKPSQSLGYIVSKRHIGDVLKLIQGYIDLGWILNADGTPITNQAEAGNQIAEALGIHLKEKFTQRVSNAYRTNRPLAFIDEIQDVCAKRCLKRMENSK